MESHATGKEVTRKDLLDLEERLTKKLATREAVDVLANQALKNTNDIDEIKTEIKTINHKIDRLDEKFDNKINMVLDAVDTVLKEITNNRTEKAAYDHALSRHDIRLENHEQRIQNLESTAV